MASISKVIMVATAVMVISLAVIIALLLLLLAELYFNLFLTRRRQRRLSNSNSNSGNRLPVSPLPSPPLPLRTLFTQGVIRAPRSLLFPPTGSDIENHHFQLLHFLNPIHNNTTPSVTARPISPVSETTSSSGGGGSDKWNDLVCISNPMYDNANINGGGGVVVDSDTPFETPETSPSNLGNVSGEEESCNTPPLIPMKVPDKGCSISMKNGRFLASSGTGSESNSKNGMSSSSTGSPCTSPSW